MSVHPGTLCHGYPRYVVVEWGMQKSDPDPVAIVRPRPGTTALTAAQCRPDSLPGDFVVRTEWQAFFFGVWGDLIFLDFSTSELGDIVLYDIPSRERRLTLEGAELEGVVDSLTLAVWLLKGEGSHAQCPEIPETLDVGLDSLFALHLPTLALAPLGKERCHPLQ